jgi:hypothetical protein
MGEISSWKTRIVMLRLVFLISGIVVYKESFSGMEWTVGASSLHRSEVTVWWEGRGTFQDLKRISCGKFGDSALGMDWLFFAT